MGVYVHIPFCEQKCYYCDFHSVVVGDQRDFSLITGNYLVSMRQEARYWANRWGKEPLTTLFIGGGTPSILPPEELASFITFLREELPFVADPEISMEANPHSLTTRAAEILASAGVNRVSLGVQAFQDSLLKAIGRVHTGKQAVDSVDALKRVGLTNINLDLMFGLPGQSNAAWVETLKQAIALKPTHFSCYGLILEEGTPMTRWYEAGLVDFPSDDEQAEMYETACQILKEEGYEHYEISNFCKSGLESKHNLLYWENKPFIGLGSGSTGYVQRLRYTNTTDLGDYVKSWDQGTPIFKHADELSVEQEMDETMMVGMRLLQGVSEAEFRRRYEVSFLDVYNEAIQDLKHRDLVEFIDGYLRVTSRGLVLENQVSGEFLR